MSAPEVCLWCGEEDCEASCTAAQAAGWHACRGCGVSLPAAAPDLCPRCDTPGALGTLPPGTPPTTEVP